MAKQANNSIIKVLIILFIIFFAGVTGYEYFQYGSIFNNSEHYRKIYAQALIQKNNEEYAQAFSTLEGISPRYEAYDAVLFQQAQCAVKNGNELLAQKSLKSLINKYPQSYLYIPAKYDLAKSFLRAKDYSSATDVFQNIINSHPKTNYETGSYYYLANILSNKQKQTAVKYWKKYIEQSKDGRFSLECANNILNNSTELSTEDNLNLGLVYFNAKKYSDAIKYLNNANIEQAWYYLAQAHFAQKENRTAKEIINIHLGKYYKNFSQKELSEIMNAYANTSYSKAQAWDELCKISANKDKIEDIALFNKAKYSPQNNAIELYKKIVEHHIKGDYASESLKKLFWYEFKAKKYNNAKKLALKHIDNFTNTKSATEMHYWLAKTYEKENNKDAALKMYYKILSKYPDDYYAMRAFGRISYLTQGKDYGWQINPRGTIDQEDFSLELPYNYSEIKTKFGATLAELLLVEDFATIEFFEDFSEPFIESWIYYKKGLRSTATTTARNAMEEYSEKPDRTSNKWKFVYPCYFMAEINKYSTRNQITPYIMISIIREESYFNPLALSQSNAVGLTQILPSTAKEVSARQGYGRINEFLLFNPETNIKFGTTYFAQIRKQLNGNNLYAVAAYNGGAGAVSSWIQKNNYSDLDEFVENIPYPETKNYVKKVFRSYWNYSRIYGK